VRRSEITHQIIPCKTGTSVRSTSSSPSIRRIEKDAGNIVQGILDNPYLGYHDDNKLALLKAAALNRRLVIVQDFPAAIRGVFQSGKTSVYQAPSNPY
jgi:hypothetical protein